MGGIEAFGDAVTGGLLARAVEPEAGEADGHTHEKCCLNCGTPLTGPYCSACGQKAHAHRYPEAKAEVQKELERDPEFWAGPSQVRELTCGRKANSPERLVNWEFIFKEGTWSPDAKGYRELAEAGFSSRPEGTAWRAVPAAITGDRNKAVDYLEKAYANREIELVLCIRYPTFDPI